MDARHLLWDLNLSTIVLENYRIYPWMARALIGNNLLEVRMIGRIREIARHRHIEFVEITPSQAKRRIDDFDLNEMTSEIPLGELDLTDLSYTLMKDDILDQLAEGGDTGNALAQEVLSIIFDNELINFSFEEEQFVLTAGVSKFRSNETDIPAYLYDLHFKEMVDGVEVIGEFDPDSFDPESYIVDMFTEYIFNSALVGGGFEIYEKTFYQH